MKNSVAEILSVRIWPCTVLVVKLGYISFSADLTSRFSSTDQALDSLIGWPKFSLADANLFNSRTKFQIRLEDHR